MVGKTPHATRRAAAWAAGVSLVFASLCASAAGAQGFPPIPQLPPAPSLPSFGPPAYTPSQSGNCGAQDWTCRIDRLERRVADLEDQLDRVSDRNADRGGGRRGRSVDITVDQDCIFDSCSGIATKLCTNAGFARGVPVEMRQNGAWQRVVRATCLD